jgi:hypothetical protein
MAVRAEFVDCAVAGGRKEIPSTKSGTFDRSARNEDRFLLLQGFDAEDDAGRENFLSAHAPTGQNLRALIDAFKA